MDSGDFSLLKLVGVSTEPPADATETVGVAGAVSDVAGASGAVSDVAGVSDTSDAICAAL